MRKVLNAISEALGMIKGFDTGTTSRIDNRMIIDYKGERYVASLTKIENPDENIFEDIDRFL